MPLLVQTLLLTVVVPGAVALAVVLAGRRWAIESGWCRASAAVAVFGAQLAGSWGLIGRPELVPLDISQWLVHVGATGAATAVVLEALVRERAVASWIVRGAGSLLAAYLVLRPVLGQRWTGAASVLAVVVAGATLLAYGSALDRLTRRAGPRVGATAALIGLVTAASAVGASGSLTVAQLGGAAAAGLGAVWIVALIRPAPIAAVAPVAAAIGWGLVGVAVIYAAMPMRVGLAVLAVPLVAAGARELVGKSSPRRAAIVIVAATLVAAAVATGLAVSAGLPSTSGDADYGYG